MLENLQALCYTCNAQKQNKDGTLTLENGEKMCMMQGTRIVCLFQPTGRSKTKEFACNGIHLRTSIPLHKVTCLSALCGIRHHFLNWVLRHRRPAFCFLVLDSCMHACVADARCTLNFFHRKLFFTYEISPCAIKSFMITRLRFRPA